MKNARGMSLAEVVVAAFILLLVVIFMWTTVGATYMHEHGLREHATVSLLARAQMDLCIKQPLQALVQGPAFFSSATYGQYQYNQTSTNIDREIYDLSVQVTSPAGKSVTYHAAIPYLQQWGVTVNGSNVVYADATQNDLRNVDATSPTPGPSPPPNAVFGVMPNGGIPVGVAYVGVTMWSNNPGYWVGDRVNNGVWRADPSGNTWDAGTFTTTSAAGVCGGLAYNHNPNWGTDILIYADRTNHGVWCLWNNTYYDWKGVFTASPPLGDPVGVASGKQSGCSWVADATNHCLRYFTTQGEYFTSDIYRPPTSLGHVLGMPRGIACTDDSLTVWVEDSQRLWKMTVSLDPSSGLPDPSTQSWTYASLPILNAATTNPSDLGSGLAYDAASNTLWLDTKSGTLYKFNPTTMVGTKYFPYP